MNTAITSMEHRPTRTYVPSLQELFITLGLAAFGFVAFSFVARYFDVFVARRRSAERYMPVSTPALTVAAQSRRM